MRRAQITVVSLTFALGLEAQALSTVVAQAASVAPQAVKAVPPTAGNAARAPGAASPSTKVAPATASQTRAATTPVTPASASETKTASTPAPASAKPASTTVPAKTTSASAAPVKAPAAATAVKKASGSGAAPTSAHPAPASAAASRAAPAQATTAAPASASLQAKATATIAAAPAPVATTAAQQSAAAAPHAVAPAPAASPSVAATITPEMQKGEVDSRLLPHPGTSAQLGRAMALISAPADEVTAVLQDYAKYQTFLPNFEASRVLSQRGAAALVYLQVSILHGAATIWAQVKLNPKDVAPGKRVIEATMMKGNVSRFEASWEIMPVDPQHTVVAFQIFVDPDLPVPTSLINHENQKNARKAVAALRDLLAQRKQRVKA